jgi:hypothetical protein
MAKRVTIEALAKKVDQLTDIVAKLASAQVAAKEPERTAAPEPESVADINVVTLAKPRTAVGYVPPKPVARPLNQSTKTAQTSKPVVGVVSLQSRAELWAYDEYNQGSIIGSGKDIAKLVEQAKKFVTETNVDNALTLDEKDNQWEAYFPEIWVNGRPSVNAVYAGDKQDGHPYYYVRNTDGTWTKQPVPRNADLHIYLGEINRGRMKDQWYLADHKGNEITDLKSPLLERKTVLFIKIVG